MGSRNLWEELKEKFREISKNNVPELNQNDDVPELNQNVEIRRYLTSDKNIFYVLVNENECCRLEFRIQYGNRYQDMIQKLKPKFPLRDFEYRTYYTNSIWIQRQRITKADELEKDLKKMTDIINIKENLKPDTGQQDAPPVRICVMTAEELLKKPIQIPDYQRPYCWKEKNVRDFLVDIDLWKKDKGDSGIPYHLGTIILKEKEENGGNATLDIIDGQQRLTTMAIVKFCQMQEQPPLLNSKKNYTKSEKETILRARNYIKNSKIEIDFTGIVLSVVILRKDQPEDLAYTFFSNSNSTGKRLSDYDLLKNHHLRYISSDRHAERFSKRWHELEKSGCQDDVLQKMLFRLRKWSNNEIFPFEACNREERDIDRATDVLSFPMCDFTEGEPPAEPEYDLDPETGMMPLGDMIISVERARDQGEEYGHGFERECAYLTVHSMLHLLGYDHTDEGGMKARMRKKEEEIMSLLGLERK